MEALGEGMDVAKKVLLAQGNAPSPTYITIILSRMISRRLGCLLLLCALMAWLKGRLCLFLPIRLPGKSIYSGSITASAGQ